VDDAGDRFLGVEAVQVGEAEQCFGADDDGEVAPELCHGGAGGAEGVIQRGEGAVDHAEPKAGAALCLAGPGDGRRDQGADNALTAQDVAQQEFGGGGDPRDRVGRVGGRPERFLHGGQLVGDGFLQEAGEVGKVAVDRGLGDQGSPGNRGYGHLAAGAAQLGHGRDDRVARTELLVGAACHALYCHQSTFSRIAG